MNKYYGVFQILKENYPQSINECPLYYKEAAKFYDRIAITYDDYPMFQEQAILHGGPILELCCGSGRLTLPLAKAGFKITAVDLSEDMLSTLQSSLYRKYRRVKDNVTYVQADMTKLELDEKFNFIMIGATSIRLMENDFTDFFNQMYDLLNPNGCFYFNFEDLPIKNDVDIVNEPLYMGVFDDANGNPVIVNMLRIFQYSEKRATVNFISFSPDTDEKMLLSHTEYRIFGIDDIKESAEKSAFGKCEIIPTKEQGNYFCKMVKR